MVEASYRTMVLFIGAIVAAIIGIWIGLSPTGIVKQSITEEVLVTHRVGDVCIVDTTDTTLSAKQVKNCTAVEGSRITVRYEQGSTEAFMVP